MFFIFYESIKIEFFSKETPVKSPALAGDFIWDLLEVLIAISDVMQAFKNSILLSCILVNNKLRS